VLFCKSALWCRVLKAAARQNHTGTTLSRSRLDSQRLDGMLPARSVMAGRPVRCNVRVQPCMCVVNVHDSAVGCNPHVCGMCGSSCRIVLGIWYNFSVLTWHAMLYCKLDCIVELAVPNILNRYVLWFSTRQHRAGYIHAVLQYVGVE
jgi:hypothetical protein